MMTGRVIRSDDAFIPGTSIPLPSTQANDIAATMKEQIVAAQQARRGAMH